MASKSPSGPKPQVTQSAAPASADLQQMIAAALAAVMAPVLSKLDAMQQEIEEIRDAEFEEDEDMDVEQLAGAIPAQPAEALAAEGGDSKPAVVKRRRVRFVSKT